MICLPESRLRAAASRRKPGYLGAAFEVGERRAASICFPPAVFAQLSADYAPGFGPGTELKKLLARFGLKPEKNCRCKSRAARMDRQGADWCERNLAQIVGWMAEEAARRGLPFSEKAARWIVRRSINACQ